MVMEKLVGTQKAYLRWHKDDLGFKFLQQDGLEDFAGDFAEVVIAPFTIASLALFRHLDGNNVAMVSENPHYGDGKALGNPTWGSDLPATVKTAVLKSLEINRRRYAPYGWNNWAGEAPTQGAGHSLLARTLLLIYSMQNHDGEYQVCFQPDNFVYECNIPGTYGVVRREGSGSIDLTLLEQVSKELLEWHVDRTPPHHVDHHSDKWREYAVIKLAVQSSLVSGKFELALRYAADFFNMPEGMMVAGAEGIAERHQR